MKALPSRNRLRVSGCAARHCIKARALQTRVEAWEERAGGDRRGYIDSTSCNKTTIIPKANFHGYVNLGLEGYLACSTSEALVRVDFHGISIVPRELTPYWYLQEVA